MKLPIIIFSFCILTSICYGQNNRTFSQVKTDRPHTNEEAILSTPDFDITKSSENTDTYAIIRSTLGASGSSVSISSGDEIYIINQSIGQESVIGTFNKDEYTLRQGYQQPGIAGQIVPIPLESDLEATIYPNPFKQSVNISFDELITSDILVTIVNIMGKITLSQKFPASQLINLQLQYLPKGIYVVKVNAINKQFTARLTKQ